MPNNDANKGREVGPGGRRKLTAEQWQECIEAQRLARSAGLHLTLREIAIRKGFLPTADMSAQMVSPAAAAIVHRMPAKDSSAVHIEAV